MSSPEKIGPYVGLRPYTEDERQYFFGRERDQRIITSNFFAAPLTVLYGDSGVGKSSVLLAGVVPNLRKAARAAVVVFRDWRDVSFLPTLKSECIQAVAKACQKPVEVDEALPLDDVLFAALQKFRGSIFILLDQFEEYFLYHSESLQKDFFDAEFARSVNREEIDANFLVVLRDDGLSKLDDRFRARIPNLLGNTLRLKHLDETAAKDAIQKPLKVYNEQHAPPDTPITIEDDLVSSILTQVRSGEVKLGKSGGVGQSSIQDGKVQIETPFLQLVLTRLWEEEIETGSRALRLSTFDRLGGAQEIVRRHLDDTMEELNHNEQIVCAKIFDRLVTPSRSKIACSLADLEMWAKDFSEYLILVLNTLTDARILRSVATKPGEEAQSYEIFHDVMAPAILDWRSRWVQALERKEAAKQLVRERRTKWLAFGLVGLLVGLIMMGMLAFYGFQQRNRAKQEARAAFVRELSMAARSNLNENPERSVLLALHAVSTISSDDQAVRAQAEDALHRAVQAVRVRTTFMGHVDTVRSVAFSPDGARLATTSADKTIKLWDVSTGQEVLNLTGHANWVYDVAFSPDGARLATVSADKTIKLWDVSTGKEVLNLTGHASWVYDVAFSPDGKYLATASEDKTARVWDLSTGKVKLNLSGHKKAVRGVDFSPDGRRLATVSDDKTARLWDLSSGQTVLTFSGHTLEIYGVAFSSDGKRLATASRDKSLKLWDTSSAKEVLTFKGHESTVFQVTFSPDGTRLASASFDNTAKVWDTSLGQEVLNLSGHTNWVYDVAFSPDGTRLATASKDKTARVWNVSFSQEVTTLFGHQNAISGVAFSPDGTHLATASHDKTVRIWLASSGKELQTLKGHTYEVYGVAFSPDGKYLATAGRDMTARVWDVSSGKELRTLRGHDNTVYRLTFSPDGTRLATASFDKTAKIWDVSSGKELQTLQGHTDRVHDVAFSPDGMQLATASKDKTARVWDVSSGKTLRTISDHNADVYGVAFSPDGRLMATASADKTVIVWDAATGQKVHRLSGHSRWVYGVTFSPDSTRLATASWDKTTKVWAVASGQELLTLSGHTSVVYDLAFSPYASYLATSSHDKTVRVYALNIDELIGLAWKRVTRTLTTEECQKYLHMDQCPTQP